MLALVLRGFVQRKLRVLLTGIAIALGVALMAGTYILTDTINHSFAGIFHTADESKSVIVTPTQNLGRGVRSEDLADRRSDARTGARDARASPQAAGAIFTPGDAARRRTANA